MKNLRKTWQEPTIEPKSLLKAIYLQSQTLAETSVLHLGSEDYLSLVMEVKANDVSFFETEKRIYGVYIKVTDSIKSGEFFFRSISKMNEI